jgi:hypothetical protein
MTGPCLRRGISTPYDISFGDPFSNYHPGALIGVAGTELPGWRDWTSLAPPLMTLTK